MSIQPVILTTDLLIYALFILIGAFCLWARSREHLLAPWRQVFKNRIGLIALTIIFFYAAVGLLDSVHYRSALPSTANGAIHYSPQVKTLLDKLIAPIGQHSEKTYSAPFALHLYSKESVERPNGTIVRIYPKLKYGGADLARLERTKSEDIFIRILYGMGFALIVWLIFSLCYVFLASFRNRGDRERVSFSSTIKTSAKKIVINSGEYPHRLFLVTLLILFAIIAIALELSREYHIFGTDKVGQDVFYQAIKSIRTGLIIGTLTTLLMLPFALILGTMAGYFGGLTDDIIQYIYTTLSSIPGVLLIAAAILSLQIYISHHQDLFPTLAQRADARLLALCLILGVTSWTGLCRLLRAETLKLRDIDYIQAAKTLGVKRLKIITRHILPNVMYIVIISVVLDFSGLVLAEAILSYVGVGVDPTTMSWGNMINSARLELAREPVVWWPLLAAFVFMFLLVLCANLFSDSVRDAFDPRNRIR